MMHESRVERRDFLKTCIRGGSVIACADLLLPGGFTRLLDLFESRALASEDLGELAASAPVARYWAPMGRGIGCRLCARRCVIAEGERGHCQARLNDSGELRSLVYGRPVTVHIDPIEKGPFFHFLPGSSALTMATTGCPLSCKFCQNWGISQAKPEDYGLGYTAPDGITSAAESRGARAVMFTYNEPTIFIEYMTDIARLARAQGLRPVLISCGFMTKEPLSEMCEVLDAIKIDLKGFSPDFYRQVCNAELEPVLSSIKQVAASRSHLEIVNLVVPTLNDSDAMLTDLAEWVAGEIGPDVPLHFSRFQPEFQLRNLPPTPVATLERAREIAMSKGLRYVYVGNVPAHPGTHTYCPACNEPVIERTGFFLRENRVKSGVCPACGEAIPGVWS